MRFFGIFFSLFQPVWVLDEQSKLVSLKNSFSWKIFVKNMTPRSVILCGVGLLAVSNCAESNNLIWFLKTSSYRTLRVYVMIFRKYFENKKMANTARSYTPQSITLRRILPGTILSLQATPCFQWEY